MSFWYLIWGALFICLLTVVIAPGLWSSYATPAEFFAVVWKDVRKLGPFLKKVRQDIKDTFKDEADER